MKLLLPLAQVHLCHTGSGIKCGRYFYSRIYIYIYTYIVILRQICFVLSELISVARHTRFPQLGSKPS